VGGYFLAFGLKVPRIEADNDTLLAAGFALLAAFSFGSSTVFSKKILYKYSFFTATFYRYGFTAVLMLVVVAANGNIGALTETSSTQWIYFLIIAFTTGSGAIYLYYFGLRRVKAMVATICELFFPISAVLFDYIFNDYQLSMVQWLSAVVMIFAIVQLNRQNDRRKKEA